MCLDVVDGAGIAVAVVAVVVAAVGGGGGDDDDELGGGEKERGSPRERRVVGRVCAVGGVGRWRWREGVGGGRTDFI